MTTEPRPIVPMTALTEGLREGYETRIAELTNALREVTEHLAKREELIGELRAELRAKETNAESLARSTARIGKLIRE